MKKFMILALSVFLCLTSCELVMKEAKPNINLISVALNYKNSGVEDLESTLADQIEVINQINLLSDKAGYKFTSYQMTEDSGEFSFNGNNAGISFIDDIETLFKDTLPNSIKDNDITIFYYSGHGAQASSFGDEYNGALFVGLDKTGGTSAIQEKNLLSIETLHSYITPLKGKKLIILDSCFSGEVVEDTGNALTSAELFQKGFEKLFSNESIDNKNTWYITASSDTEKSFEEPDFIGHGYFTYELIKALGFDTENNVATDLSPLGTDKMITLNEIYHFIDTNIKTNNAVQTTQNGKSIIDLVLFKWD